MRINPDSSSSLILMLQRTQEQEQTSLRQLSSGRRVEKPSDDPAACAASAANQQMQSQLDQYTQSVSSVEEILRTGDSTLNSVVTALQRAVSLGVEGATGTLSAENRSSLANEIQGIQDEILELANTSFRGAYLFAGTNVLSRPFVKDATSPAGVAYMGNQEVNRMPIGESRTVSAGTAGDSLFLDPTHNVFLALSQLDDALNSNDASGAADATVNVRQALAHVTNLRVAYGNNLNQLESQNIILQQETLEARTREDDLIGSDEAVAITNLRQAQFARDATLAAAARTQFTSLLDYLR